MVVSSELESRWQEYQVPCIVVVIAVISSLRIFEYVNSTDVLPTYFPRLLVNDHHWNKSKPSPGSNDAQLSSSTKNTPWEVPTRHQTHKLTNSWNQDPSMRYPGWIPCLDRENTQTSGKSRGSGSCHSLALCNPRPSAFGRPLLLHAPHNQTRYKLAKTDVDKWRWRSPGSIPRREASVASAVSWLPLLILAVNEHSWSMCGVPRVQRPAGEAAE
jgi:hypothetical protein